MYSPPPLGGASAITIILAASRFAHRFTERVKQRIKSADCARPFGFSETRRVFLLQQGPVVFFYPVGITQEALFVGKTTADMPQSGSEETARLALWSVAPEKIGQPIAGLGPVPNGLYAYSPPSRIKTIRLNGSA